MNNILLLAGYCIILYIFKMNYSKLNIFNNKIS